jgi:hypothetical protein
LLFCSSRDPRTGRNIDRSNTRHSPSHSYEYCTLHVRSEKDPATAFKTLDNQATQSSLTLSPTATTSWEALTFGMSKRHGDDESCGRMLHDGKRARTSGSWASLPVEIRLMILGEISHQRNYGWASCAAVCKEWQVFLEGKNFHRLTLRPECLEKLNDMVIRQRRLVRHICLIIDLPGYTCRTCRTETGPWRTQQEAITQGALLKLYSVLSTWEPRGRLILEITACSPSDSDHWFKNYRFGLDHDCAEDSAQQQRATVWHDPDHGWVNGQQVEAPSASAILRLFSILCVNFAKPLPMVHAVTGLVIRRQLRRLIFPWALGRLCKSLPQLESIVYEPWRVWKLPWKNGFDISKFLYRRPV